MIPYDVMHHEFQDITWINTDIVNSIFREKFQWNLNQIIIFFSFKKSHFKTLSASVGHFVQHPISNGLQVKYWVTPVHEL